MGGFSSSEIRFPVPIGNPLPLVVIGGINVLESLELALEVAELFREACRVQGLGYVFKASFDKANRSSGSSFRGPGLERGLAWLQQVKQQLHSPSAMHSLQPMAALLGTYFHHFHLLD